MISPALSNLRRENAIRKYKSSRSRAYKRAKKQIIAEITDTLARVLGKDPAAILVMIETLGMDSIGKSGLSLEEIKQNKEKK
nr:tautomerase family protein [uncultured Campylobacter sp.]